MSCSWKTHELQFGHDLPIRRWFGVIASKLLISSLAAVRGRLFTMLSTSVRNVNKASSVNTLSLKYLNPSLSVFSPNTGKYGPEITPYLDTFHAVWTPQHHPFMKQKLN